ncbi:VOC family protein [Pseudonocardia sp.]|uniref:VOC family protein n=1 Tax=Pseudonocardia sp. TaxID=60912 RepID=UPI003D0A5053
MSIYPTLRYDDAAAAIRFLTAALGLAELAVHADDGVVQHAELAHDDGVVMIGTRRGGDTFDTGRAVLYIAVEDADAHHDRAVAAGAEVVMPLTDQPYGSREYAVRDPEGNVWSVGTYRSKVS